MEAHEYSYDWQRDIAPRIPRLEQSDQGFTNAYTGLISLADGSQVFVKCAIDNNSARWARKEIKSYKLLAEAGYEHMSQLLAVNADMTSFAIQSLANYDFSPTWDTDKLHAVMRARKDLKALRYLFEGDADFSMRKVIGVQNRWPMLRDEALLARANDILQRTEAISVSTAMVERCEGVLQTWNVHQDTLVHDDLRADNFAYDLNTKTGKLIDWAWLCVGDDTLDVASLCVGIARTGFDVYGQYPDLFNEQAIVSTLGYWLEILGSSDGTLTEARRSQARSVRLCIDLLKGRTQLVI